MSEVFFKFKSQLKFDKLTFDGLHISVSEVKRSIMNRKKMKIGQRELQITNACTKEEYVGEDTLIPHNTSLIIVRLPLSSATPKVIEAPVEQVISSAPVPLQESKAMLPLTSVAALYNPKAKPSPHQPMAVSKVVEQLAEAPNLSEAVGSEEDKIAAVQYQSAKEFDTSQMANIPSYAKPLEKNYICFRCNKPGHHIKNCPTQGDTQYEATKTIRKATGIPCLQTVPAKPTDPGAVLTQYGQYVVPIIDKEAYQNKKIDKLPFVQDDEEETVPAPIEIPSDLKCPLCMKLFKDAIVTPCCGESFCDECIINKLLKETEGKCHVCDTPITPSGLIPNKYLRTAVNKYEISVNKTVPNIPSDVVFGSPVKKELLSSDVTKSPLNVMSSPNADDNGKRAQTVDALRCMLGAPPSNSDSANTTEIENDLYKRAVESSVDTGNINPSASSLSLTSKEKEDDNVARDIYEHIDWEVPKPSSVKQSPHSDQSQDDEKKTVEQTKATIVTTTKLQTSSTSSMKTAATVSTKSQDSTLITHAVPVPVPIPIPSLPITGTDSLLGLPMMSSHAPLSENEFYRQKQELKRHYVDESRQYELERELSDFKHDLYLKRTSSYRRSRSRDRRHRSYSRSPSYRSRRYSRSPDYYRRHSRRSPYYRRSPEYRRSPRSYRHESRRYSREKDRRHVLKDFSYDDYVKWHELQSRHYRKERDDYSPMPHGNPLKPLMSREDFKRLHAKKYNEEHYKSDDVEEVESSKKRKKSRDDRSRNEIEENEDVRTSEKRRHKKAKDSKNKSPIKTKKKAKKPRRESVETDSSSAKVPVKPSFVVGSSSSCSRSPEKKKPKSKSPTIVKPEKEVIEITKTNQIKKLTPPLVEEKESQPLSIVEPVFSVDDDTVSLGISDDQKSDLENEIHRPVTNTNSKVSQRVSSVAIANSESISETSSNTSDDNYEHPMLGAVTSLQPTTAASATAMIRQDVIAKKSKKRKSSEILIESENMSDKEVRRKRKKEHKNKKLKKQLKHKNFEVKQKKKKRKSHGDERIESFRHMPFADHDELQSISEEGSADEGFHKIKKKKKEKKLKKQKMLKVDVKKTSVHNRLGKKHDLTRRSMYPLPEKSKWEHSDSEDDLRHRYDIPHRINSSISVADQRLSSSSHLNYSRHSQSKIYSSRNFTCIISV